jgi:hypothetical protein
MKSTKLYDASIYPYLGIHKSGYPVVLFTERNQGTVVSISPNPDVYTDFLGEFRKDWIMDYFDKFTGRIVLEN